MKKKFLDFQKTQLQRDVLFLKIPEKDIPIIIQTAFLVSQSLVDKLDMITTKAQLLTFLSDCGLKILYQEQRNYGSTKVYAEYVTVSKELFLYRESIERLKLKFTDDCETFILLHELFHILVEEEPINYQDYYQVDVIKWGPLRIRSGLLQLSELAANAFAYQIQEKMERTN